MDQGRRKLANTMNHRNNRDFHSTWKKITEIIRHEVGRDTFQRWFGEIQLLAFDEAQIILRVPDNIHQIWIETNYIGLLHTSVSKVLGSPRKIRFTITDTDTVAETVPDEPFVIADGMNPRNTFDSFVVGACNRFAYEAALAVARNPTTAYNPLFICGALGFGKTHLLHAIAQYVASKNKKSIILYRRCEEFASELIFAFRGGLEGFRNKYQKADMLFIDNIEFIERDVRYGKEFFHIFNALVDCQKRIILSSTKPPCEIQNLDARLVSRFEGGLIASLLPPDEEMRMAILRNKAELIGIKLDRSVLSFLAQRIRSSVRRLEMALMRVAAFASLSGRELTPDAMGHLLKDILQKESQGMAPISPAIPDSK